MAASGEDDGAREARLRQRLWGAAVLIAVLVIVLPLLLDGAGSESQFRRVERLREEPPVVLDPGAPAASAPDGPVDAATGVATGPAPRIRVGEDDPPDYLRDDGESGRDARARPADGPGPSVTAWVVQAGSFADEANAVAVRDRLRRAGHPSFVAAGDAPGGAGAVYRVRVGPMIERGRAAAVRDEVVRLLGREAIVTGYP